MTKPVEVIRVSDYEEIIKTYIVDEEDCDFDKGWNEALKHVLPFLKQKSFTYGWVDLDNSNMPEEGNKVIVQCFKMVSNSKEIKSEEIVKWDDERAMYYLDRKDRFKMKIRFIILPEES